MRGIVGVVTRNDSAVVLIASVRDEELLVVVLSQVLVGRVGVDGPDCDDATFTQLE